MDSNTFCVLDLQLSQAFFFFPAVIDCGARVTRLCSQFALDFKQAVVLCDPFTAARRTSLDLTHARGDGKIGNARIVGLTRAVRDDSAVAVFARHLNAFKRLGHSTNLV